MSFDRRTYAREYARRKRVERWSAQAMTRQRCPRMLGRGLPCGDPLRSRMVEGRTVPACERCDCKARGVCIDCRTVPVRGRMLRCAACHKRERHAAGDRYKATHPAQIKRTWQRRRMRLKADAALHAQVNARKALWRLATPKKKARYAKQWNGSATAKAYQIAYRAKRRAARRERERDRARLRANGITMTHPCTHCPTELTGRQKKCDACRTRDHTNARTLLCGAA